MSETARIDRLIEWNEKDHGTFSRGSRNDFIFNLAIKFNKEGIDKQTALSEIISRYKEKDFTDKEIITSIESAYKRNGHSKPFEKPKSFKPGISDFTTREINPVEFKYWQQYEITAEVLNRFNCLAVNHYYIGALRIESTPQNPIFCYKINNDSFKIYRPLDKKYKFSWYPENNKPAGWYFGLDHCSGDQEIFITGGEKDVMTLSSQGKEAFTLNSETASMPQDLAEKLKGRYKRIVVLYDSDSTGVKHSEKICEEFGFIRGILPAGVKDVSDLIRDGRSISEITFEHFDKKEIQEKDLEEPTLFKKVENFIRKSYELRYNEVSNEIEYKKLKEDSFEELNINNLFIELEHNRIKISIQNLEAILRSDFVPKFNPFLEYFKSLPKWNNGDPDYIEMMANYVHASDQVEFNYHFKKALVRTVACSINDSYLNKHAFILVGPKQNTGKSTFIRFLCPPALESYITETFSSVDKDTEIALSSNIIFNLDELAVLSRTDINHLKAFFAKEYIKVRHPYGKKAVRTPRRASFFGSTNNMEFLSDGTGSVRWLCFEMTEIDFKYSNEIKIDMVWSQAYHLNLNNFKFQLTPEDLDNNETRNQIHQKRSIEMELIQEIFVPGTFDEYDYKISASEVGIELKSQFNNAAISNFSNERIGTAMSLMGYVSKQFRMGNNKIPVKKYLVKMVDGKVPLSLKPKSMDESNQITESASLQQPSYFAGDNPDDLPF